MKVLLSLVNQIPQMAVPIKIPCKKYLRDFLAFYYENKEVAFTQESEDFIFMRSLVTRIPPKSEVFHEKYDSSITLMIGSSNLDRKIIYVSPTAAKRFHDRYHKLFAKYFMQWMRTEKLKVGFKIETSIHEFIKLFEWTEDEIKHDTLKKVYQREEGTKFKNNRNILRGTSPLIPLAVLF